MEFVEDNDKSNENYFNEDTDDHTTGYNKPSDDSHGNNDCNFIAANVVVDVNHIHGEENEYFDNNFFVRIYKTKVDEIDMNEFS